MNLKDFIAANRDRYLRELIEFIRIPSISTSPAHRGEVRLAAEFARDQLAGMGMDNAKLVDKDGHHPLVYAEWLRKPGKPTILVYGHYDVQPPDPLDKWLSPPFDPQVRNDNLYGRGAVDDKGQVILVFKALEALFKLLGELPVNVKVLLEGEEESGGEHIAAYVPEHAAEFGADAVFICDTDMFAPGMPTVVTGLRGILYTEITCKGAEGDLHSGLFGGAAPNALEGLTRVLSALKTPAGRIRIPNIYNKIIPPSREELASWATLPFDEQGFLTREMRATAYSGDKRISVLRRLWALPTLELHGIVGGFVDEGAKTVIPAQATAKVSLRLVPGMEPDQVFAALKAYVARVTPKGYTTSVRNLHGNRAVVVDPSNRYTTAMADAMAAVFGRKTVYKRSGGSIPVAGVFAESLKVPVILAGFGLPDDQIHAPNEKFHLPNFYAGIEAVAEFFTLLGK